jgi:hypothetical protein
MKYFAQRFWKNAYSRWKKYVIKGMCKSCPYRVKKFLDFFERNSPFRGFFMLETRFWYYLRIWRLLYAKISILMHFLQYFFLLRIKSYEDVF